MKKSLSTAAVLLFCLFVRFETNFAQTNEELINRAKAAIEKREYDSAINDLTTVITAQPKNDDAYAQRARAYFLKTNNDDSAFADAEKALNLNSKNLDALNIRGKVKVNRKQIDSALEDFNKAIKIDPNFVKPYLNRAEILIGKSEFDKSIGDYTKVIQIDPKNTAAFQGRGSVYINYKKDYANALADFNKLVELLPNFANNYTYRGRSYQLLNDPDHALFDFNKAIELNPNYYLSYFYRGNLYYLKNDYGAALADFTKALELEPKDFNANYNLGLVYRAQKKYEAAIDQLNKIPANAPAYALAQTQIKEIAKFIADDKFAATLNIASEPFKALFDPHAESSGDRVRIKVDTPYDDPQKIYSYIGRYSFTQPVQRMISAQLALSLSGGEDGGYILRDTDAIFFGQKVDSVPYSSSKIQFNIKEPLNHHYTLEVAYKTMREGTEVDIHTLDPKYLHYDSRWDLTNKILFFFGNATCYNGFISEVRDENNLPLAQNKDFGDFSAKGSYLEMKMIKFASWDEAIKGFEAALASLRKNLDATKYEIADFRTYGTRSWQIRLQSRIIKVGLPTVYLQFKEIDGEIWMELSSL